MTRTYHGMRTYSINKRIPSSLVDEAAIALRKRGFSAYVESSECGTKFYLVTDATRAGIIVVTGDGWFVE